jgi:hypothetical protein
MYSWVVSIEGRGTPAKKLAELTYVTALQGKVALPAWQAWHGCSTASNDDIDSTRDIYMGKFWEVKALT